MKNIYKIFSLYLVAVMIPLCMASCKGKYQSPNYIINIEEGNGVYHSVEQKKKVIAKYDALLQDLTELPVSFTYDGKEYRGLGSNMKERSREHISESDRITTVVKYAFKDNIEITANMTIYPDYCAYEWTLWFENKGKKNTKLLEKINCADVVYAGTDPVLQGIYGDGGMQDSGPYGPYCFKLSDEKQIHMSPETGRSTYNVFPYFNLQYGDGGTFIALGWPIMWQATFDYNKKSNGDESVHLTAGQETFSSYLQPGEKIRTPMAAFLEYEGRDYDKSMNLWRHWFIDCNMRKIDGKLFEPHISGGTSWMYAEMVKATEKNQMEAIQKYLDKGVPISYWWMDAGWYYRTGNQSLSVWLDTGTWMVDKSRFPTEFKALSDFGAANGVNMLLWFEPEVVRLNWDDHDDENGIPKEYMMDSNLANFGNPKFVQWMADRVTDILKTGGISLYRQDYGINPRGNFEAQNKKDRMGIAENLYAQGYYAYWDILIERFPNMMIDSCAAGGGRNDIESMRRAVPLHKTDHDYSNQNDKQSMHQTLFQWLPYFGTCVTGPSTNSNADVWTMRSNYAPWMAMGWNVKSTGVDWDTVQKYSLEWQEINSYFYSDYYPLTQWSRGTAGWRGWEFFDTEKNSGFFQLFRPEQEADDTIKICLKGLDDDTIYTIKNADTDESFSAPGSTLKAGFNVTLTEKRTTAMFRILLS